MFEYIDPRVKLLKWVVAKINSDRYIALAASAIPRYAAAE